MRPTLRSLAAVLLLALALPLPARAEDAPPAGAANAAADPEAREAEAVGRGLLSSDEAVRGRAVERLLARIERGGDIGAFLEAMSRANRAWADRHERLMEVWLHDAVHGTAPERERAVRLLTALGERAIRRLALELRHARLHEGADAVEPKADAAKAAAEPEQAETPDTPGPELATGIPRVYELRDLVARGMNPVELRSLLLKTADAQEVKQFKTLFVVTAADRGHELLRDRLDQLRVSYRLQGEEAGAKTAEASSASRPPADEHAPTSPASGTEAPPARDDGEPQVDVPEKTEDAPPAPVVAPEGKAAAARWRLEPTLFHLPRAALADLGGGGAGTGDTLAGLRSAAAVPTLKALVRAPDAEVVAQWTKALRQVPDARVGLPFEGETLVVVDGTTRLFAGRSIRYSQDVRRTRGGACTIVTGTIEEGLGVEVALHAEPTLLRVDLVITRTDVGQPIPVVRFQPSAQAAPLEIELPEWSRTRIRRSFDLPPEGGGALLSLDGLGDANEDQLVLTLKVTPPATK